MGDPLSCVGYVESSERTEMGIAASIMVRSEDSTHPTFASLQPLLQPVEFLQRGEGCQVVDIEVAEFVHDGMLFRGEEGSLLFAFLFRGAFGDFGFARIVEVVRFERLQDDLRAVGQQGGRLRFISMSITDGHCPNRSLRRSTAQAIFLKSLAGLDSNFGRSGC